MNSLQMYMYKQELSSSEENFITKKKKKHSEENGKDGSADVKSGMDGLA